MSRQIIYHKCSNCKKLVYAYCYDCNLALFDYKEVENGKGHSMLKTPVYKEFEVIKELKLAIRAFLVHFCGRSEDYGMAMDHIQEYASSTWDSTFDKTDRIGKKATKKSVHQSDAAQTRNNSTPVVSWTHTQGGFNR